MQYMARIGASFLLTQVGELAARSSNVSKCVPVCVREGEERERGKGDGCVFGALSKIPGRRLRRRVESCCRMVPFFS